LDSALRFEYLMGSQLLRSTNQAVNSTNQFKIEYNPRFPVLALTVEASPVTLVSGRFAGSVSVLEPDLSTSRPISPTSGSYAWEVQPDFGSWEVAGLFHVSSGGGYRFSVTGGYRNTEWRYSGDSAGSSASGVKDKFSSYIPFVGLQTSMFFPWWKARFEILGSPFMTRKSVVSMWQSGTILEQQVESRGGGLIELQAEGTVSLAPSIWIGLSGRYHYEELYGESSGGTTPPAALNYAREFYSRDSWVTMGLNLGLVY